MRKKLYVDGVDLSTFGLYISGQGTFGSGAKEYTYYNVPGRDGAVLGVNSRLENVSVTYPGFIYANFAQNMRDLRSFLLSRSGYVRIEDDYDTTHFRMGVFEEPISPDVTPVNDAGRFDLVFNCLPQRWLKSGETAIEVASGASATITNPTQFIAKPLISMYGYGSVEVKRYGMTDGVIVTILSDVSSAVQQPYFVDCENMNVWGIDGNGQIVNINDVTEFTDLWSSRYGADAPILKPGINYVSVNGDNITKVEIVPRYWEA